MTTRLYANNASDTLNGAITAVATTITLNDASEFPVPGAGEIAYATLDNSAGTVEIISYTGVSTNDLTGVTRAQDGTSASAFSDGDIVEVRANNLSFTDVLAADESPELRGPLDVYTNSQYIAFGGSSSATQYSLVASGGIPRLYGNANFYYGFTGSALYMQAGTTFNRLEVTNDSNRFRFYTNNSERFQIDDNGVNVSNGSLQVDNINIDANTIISTDTNGDINLDPNGTGNVAIGNYTFDADQTVGAGQDNYVLTYDNGTGLVSLEAASGGGGGLSAVVDDTTPQLGGDLDVNGNQIVSVSAGDIELHSDNDVNIILGDAAGVDDFNIKDSASSIVASINSDGDIQATSISFDSGVNTLSEYESGTWTAGIEDSSGNASSTSITAYYTRVGALVTVWGAFTNISTSGLTGTDNLRMTGLPYAPDQAYRGSPIEFTNLSGGVLPLSFMTSSVTYTRFVNSNPSSGGTVIDVNDLSSGTSDLRFTIVYRT